VREFVERERWGLGKRVAGRYGAELVTRDEWAVDGPLPLEELRVEHRGGAAGRAAALPGVRHLLPAGRAHLRFSQALAAGAAVGTLRNQRTYRLLAASLRGDDPRLVVGDGWYFDGLDTGAAVAHEYAAYELGELREQPLRDAIGDPTDLTRRPANLAISALTLRHDRATGTATMLLHRRDPAKVGHAGGLIQVIPSGVFQPLGPEPWNVANDLSPWRSLLHEYAEELLGAPEGHDTTAGPFDYDRWPFGLRMTAARAAGLVRPWVLGLGVDPLTLATDLLVAVVIEAGAWDELFTAAVATNSEGAVLPAVPFTAATVERYRTREPMQAAGAALLRLAHQQRAALLD
jgi:hypothetical protein